MSNNKGLPQLSTKFDPKSLNPLVDKLDLRGLTYKQRRFVFCYNGNAIAAAEAAPAMVAIQNTNLSEKRHCPRSCFA